MSALSIVMIVRDEEDQLNACKDSFLDLDSEWIIVDTGSTDATINIAETFANRVESFSWCDDFSAARNAALALCNAPWIFVIDADERMKPEGVAWLERITSEDATTAYRVQTKNFTNAKFQSGFTTDPTHKQFAGWYPSHKVRLFPNLDTIRFHGPVHEMVEPSLAKADIPIEDAPITVDHFPESKSSNSLKAKQAMYLRLGKAKIAAQPENPAAYFEYGNQCAEIGAHTEAAAALRKGLALDATKAFVWKDLGAALHLLGREEDAESALRIALRIDDTLSEAWRNLAVVLSARGNHADAIEAVDTAARLDPNWTEANRFREEIQRRLNGTD